jgi:hypothetical protein
METDRESELEAREQQGVGVMEHAAILMRAGRG